MSHHPPQIDDNNVVADAAVSTGLFLAFMAFVMVLLIGLGGVPFFGIGGGADHGGDHAAEAAH